MQRIAEALQVGRVIDLVDHGIRAGRCVVSVLLQGSSQRIVGSFDAIERQIPCRLVKIGSRMPDLPGDDDSTEADVGLLDDVFDFIGWHDLRHHGPDAMPHRQIGWHLVPESTFLSVRQGDVSLREFSPISP